MWHQLNRDDLHALAAFAALPNVDQMDEPSGLEPHWWRLAGLAEAEARRSLDAAIWPPSPSAAPCA